MPLDYCHPNTPHKKLNIPEWYVSSLMMDRALDAVVRRVKKLDRNHDIPYLAGYSRDGKTIYIDRHMPPSLRYRGRDIDTDRFLILHEEVEKTLIDQLNLHYLHAHQIATRAEQAAVRAAGIEWRDYDRFMQKYVKEIGDERLTQVPADPAMIARMNFWASSMTLVPASGRLATSIQANRSVIRASERQSGGSAPPASR